MEAMELPWVMRKALRLVSELQARVRRALRCATKEGRLVARRGVNRRAERSGWRADSTRRRGVCHMPARRHHQRRRDVLAERCVEPRAFSDALLVGSRRRDCLGAYRMRRHGYDMAATRRSCAKHARWLTPQLAPVRLRSQGSCVRTRAATCARASLAASPRRSC